MLSNVVDVDSIINDALGTTVGSWEGRASSRPESGLRYSAAALTAFGENVSVDSPTPTQNSNFFTGKPYVEGLGLAFWMRNYRAGLAKWQSADPMGYPDGWNQLAYCNNAATSAVDLWGCVTVHHVSFGWIWAWSGDVAIANGTPIDLPLTIPSVSPSAFNNLISIIANIIQGAIEDLKLFWDAFQIAKDAQGCGATDDIASRAQSAAEEKVASWYPNAESIEVESIEPLRILEINVDNQGKLLWFHSMRVLFLIHVKVVEE